MCVYDFFICVNIVFVVWNYKIVIKKVFFFLVVNNFFVVVCEVNVF